VTYDLFITKLEGEGDAEQPKVEDNMEESQLQPKEPELKKVLIPEVVREKKMFFFNGPRLGSYLALDISYQSSLSKEVVLFLFILVA